MKIELNKLTEDQPIVLEEKIPAGNWQMDSDDVSFVNDIDLKGEFSRQGNCVMVDVSVGLDMKVNCSRCLNESDRKDKKKFKLSYLESDLGDELDIDSDVREELLLQFPMRVLCEDNCKGLCPGCGVDLNKEQCKCLNTADKKANKISISKK